MFESSVVYVCLDCMQVGGDSQFSDDCRVVGVNIGAVGSREFAAIIRRDNSPR
jgi:hypothetical protein